MYSFSSEATKVVSMQLCRAGPTEVPHEVPVDAWAVVDVVDVPATVTLTVV